MIIVIMGKMCYQNCTILSVRFDTSDHADGFG